MSSLNASYGWCSKPASTTGLARAPKERRPSATFKPTERRELAMPLVRIDISKDAPVERVRVVSQAVYGAMTDVANVPVNDKFQTITRHTAEEIIYPEEGYLGCTYTPDLIFIQVTWVAGRSTDVKKAFYHRIADEIHEK